MKLYEAYKLAETSLEGLYDARQSRSIALIFMGVSQLDLVLNPNQEIVIEDFQTKLDLLIKGMPVQYIVGQQEFLGRNFRVDSSTLIPRPETEELVNLIVNHHKGLTPRILDIGTGSGAIAVSLALELPLSLVTGWDISFDTLGTAKKNAKWLGAKNITFKEVDVFRIETRERYDIIVSNPPYVTPAQREAMHVNVLGYEPHSALFVEQDDPLVFYRKIADLAVNGLLRSGGWLYFEINELYPNECMKLLKKRGFTKVKMLHDMYDKPRIVFGQLK